MIGHSTLLIEMGGYKLLTDPYFGTWGHIAFSRPNPPARKAEEMLGVNLVLVTHNHWDHTDRRYLRALPDSTPVLAPALAAWQTRLLGARALTGMRAWEQQRFGSLSVTAVPAMHIALTVGYVIECEGESLYFAGDTYYAPFFKEIGRRFQLSAALIPVTTYRVPMTMGEQGAVKAVRDLNPAVVIPIHLGIRPRSPLMRTNHSPQGFARRLKDAGVSAQVVVLQEGQCWNSK
jgi:L-ascorbate metabolism protein UlaG (beta-lactamase superfamily)